jgi:hypothetical protein
MTAQTQKSLTTLGIFGVVVFLAWKIWPTVKHAISGGGSSGTGGTSGGVSAGNPYDYPRQQQGSGSGGGASVKIPDLGPPSFGSNIGKFLYNFTRSQTLASGGPLSDSLYGSAAGYDSTALDNYQIPYTSIDQFISPSTSIDWSNPSSSFDSSSAVYDPSLDNFQLDAAGLDLGSGGGGGGYYGGIVDPGGGGGGDNPDYTF